MEIVDREDLYLCSSMVEVIDATYKAQFIGCIHIVLSLF